MKRLAQQLQNNKVKQQIKEEFNEDKELKHNKGTNPVKRQVQRVHSAVQVYIEFTNMLLSYIVIGAYLYATYHPKSILLLKVRSGHVYPIFSLTAHIFFFLEYLLQLYVQKNFQNYILSRDSIVNFLTTVPYLIVIPMLEDVVGAALFVKMLDLIRLMTLARIIDYNSEGSQNIMKNVLHIILRVICLVLVMGGIVRLWETIDDPEQIKEDFQFDRVIFFVMTTVSTIGYGSKIISTAGRITIIICLAFVVYFIPN